MKIVITGGSGFIGTKLVEAFIRRGWEVAIIDIAPPKFPHPKIHFYLCDLVADPIPKDALLDANAIIHLAGKPIFGRWTKKLKQDIYHSRIVSTRRLIDAVRQSETKPEVLVSASAVGFYGNTGDALVNEEFPHGNDFLASVSLFWENEAKTIDILGVRVVCIRTAHVLGKGGFLEKAVRPFRFFVGGWFGFGKQWFPWIHWEDLISIYEHAVISKDMKGPYNAAAPEKVTQKQLMRAVGKVLHRPAWLPIPLFVIRCIYGSFVEVFSVSQKIDSSKLEQTGFIFAHQNVTYALKNILED